jgi:hypothetical protein
MAPNHISQIIQINGVTTDTLLILLRERTIGVFEQEVALKVQVDE